MAKIPFIGRVRRSGWAFWRANNAAKAEEPLLSIAVDDADYNRLLARLGRSRADVDKVIRNAVNRTAGTGANLVRKGFKEKINVTDKDIKRAVGRRLARPGELSSSVIITKQPLPLRAYKPTQTKRGVKVRFRKDGPVTIFKHLFIAELPRPDKSGTPQSGGVKQTTQVAARAEHLPTKGPQASGFRRMTLHPKRRRNSKGKWVYGPFKKYTTRARIKLTPDGFAGSFAIKKQFGPSLLKHFGIDGSTDIAKKALSGIRETLRKNLDNQVRWFLSGRRNLTESQREAS